MTHERTRSKSPFPSAYKVLNDIENDREDTLKIPITEEFIAASKQKHGVWCQKCGHSDETGLDWYMELILDEEGRQMYAWTCGTCQPKEPPVPTDYRFSGTTLDNSVEQIKLPKRKTSRHK